MTEVERCWRCGAWMEWRHATWQCPRCRFKLGCCEGEPDGCDARPEAGASPLVSGTGGYTRA